MKCVKIIDPGHSTLYLHGAYNNTFLRSKFGIFLNLFAIFLALIGFLEFFYKEDHPQPPHQNDAWNDIIKQKFQKFFGSVQARTELKRNVKKIKVATTGEYRSR